MQIFIYLLIISGFIFLGNCAPKGSSSPAPGAIPSPEEGQKLGEGELAQGQINGQEWAFKSGRAFSLSKFQQNYVVVQLWSEKYADPCNERTGSSQQVRLMAPYSSSSWSIAPEDPFNANISIFFSDSKLNLRPRDSMRADQGEIQLGAVNSQEVRGFVAGSFNNSRVGVTNVEGEFIVPFCSTVKGRRW